MSLLSQRNDDRTQQEARDDDTAPNTTNSSSTYSRSDSKNAICRKSAKSVCRQSVATILLVRRWQIDPETGDHRLGLLRLLFENIKEWRQTRKATGRFYRKCLYGVCGHPNCLSGAGRSLSNGERRKAIKRRKKERRMKRKRNCCTVPNHYRNQGLSYRQQEYNYDDVTRHVPIIQCPEHLTRALQYLASRDESQREQQFCFLKTRIYAMLVRKPPVKILQWDFNLVAFALQRGAFPQESLSTNPL